MIILMKEKQFLKNKKKLVEPKDYVIGDATGSPSGEISKFVNAVTLDGLQPPKGLVKMIETAPDKLDPEKIEKIEKKFLKSEAFQDSILGIVLSQLKADKNYFIVFRNKDYQIYKKRFIKTLKKWFPTDQKVFYLFEDIEGRKKVLREELDSETRQQLSKSMKKKSDKLDARREQKAEKLEKERRKKDKKKDKHKKKKKKKDKYLFLD